MIQSTNFTRQEKMGEAIFFFSPASALWLSENAKNLRMKAISRNIQTITPLYVTFFWIKEVPVCVFFTCKSQFARILLDFISCVRTLKARNAKQNNLTSKFIHKQTSSSAEARTCFRQPSSYLKSLKSFYPGKTFSIKRAWLWSWHLKIDSFKLRNKS